MNLKQNDVNCKPSFWRTLYRRNNSHSYIECTDWNTAIGIDRRNQRSTFESHSLILIALVGFFVNLTGAFLFAILARKGVKFLPTLVK